MQTIQQVIEKLRTARPPGGGTAPAPAAPVCGTCQGSGWLVRAARAGQPDFGKLVPCACKEEERRAKAHAAFLARSDLRALGRLTFGSFDPAVPGVGDAYAACLEYARDVAQTERNWLVLQGRPGCGKTHLAAAIGHQVTAEHGVAAGFMLVARLLNELRASYEPGSAVSYSQLAADASTLPLLILDDLGAEQDTPWARAQLFLLLDARYSRGLATVLTTNESLERLEPRLRSRLSDRERCRHLYLGARDYRQCGSDAEPAVSSAGAEGDGSAASGGPFTAGAPDPQRGAARR